MIKLKKCQMCKLDLPEDDTTFASRYDKGHKQYQSNCRECQKKYRRLHYLNNKQKYIDKAKKYKLTLINWLGCGLHTEAIIVQVVEVANVIVKSFTELFIIVSGIRTAQVLSII